MTVSIVGCMRNGTSLTTHIAKESGLWIGEKSDLDWRGTADPDGIWENMAFVRLNNDIIRYFKSNWALDGYVDVMLGINWAELLNSSDMFLFRKKAYYLTLQLLDGQQVYSKKDWGWKDPRTSLTLPFWVNIYKDDLKVIWCYRHPSESAVSMQKRQYEGQKYYKQWWNVWHTYNQSIYNFHKNHPDIPLLMIDYKDWFTDHDNTLNRLIGFLNTEPSENSMKVINQIIKPELYRNRVLYQEQSELYKKMQELQTQMV